MPQTAQPQTLAIRLHGEAATKLRRLAALERRSPTNLVEHLLMTDGCFMEAKS